LRLFQFSSEAAVAAANAKSTASEAAMNTIHKCTVERKLDTKKVGKLVRLLSSDRDGEVIAAVAAIKRALDIADLDLHDLARAVADGFEKPKPQKRAPAKWSPPAPDIEFWESMAWWSHYNRKHLSTSDRDYVHDVLLGRHFDCGRADASMMRRLRNIVAKIEAAKADDDRW
jgi:hypothetical protein